MKQTLLLALPLLGAVAARPAVIKHKREVPQDQSHKNILDQIDALLAINNPFNITAAVFGLLGAAAAADGAGDIEDADCLQQATADSVFSTAKDEGDIDGMVAALLYRALERNTGEVGLESILCESLEAVNPEIAALQQHQDPAADGAIELNKQIALILVEQIASIGGDPFLANEAATFEPGEIGDPTAAGNTCNDLDDAGCINTQGLRVDDLLEDEILEALEALGIDVDAEDVDAEDVDAEDVDAEDVDAEDVDAEDVDAEADEEDVDAADVDEDDVDQDSLLDDDLSLLGVGGNDVLVAEFNQCNLAINFGIPSDGRDEDAFEPADLGVFNHGSALNIAVISNFICSQVGNVCGDIAASAIADCEDAAALAQGFSGQDAADAFNNALGFGLLG